MRKGLYTKAMKNVGAYSCFDSTNWLSTQNGAFPFLVDFTGADAGEGSETLATSWAFPSALVGWNFVNHKLI